MRLLLIHQNFPGQFRQLAPYLLQQGHELVAICSIGADPAADSHLEVHPSRQNRGLNRFGASIWDEGLRRAEAVAFCVDGLQGRVEARCVLAHSGWGETIALPEFLPDVPQVIWPELWVQPEHGEHCRPAQTLCGPCSKVGSGRAPHPCVALDSAHSWILSTRHQANSLPPEFQGRRLHVVHEGIDTIACPNPSVSFGVRGVTIDRSVPTITFVNRNLERLRGFDMFMRALPKIQQAHRQVRVLIVGDNEPGYPAIQLGVGRCGVMLEELQVSLTWMDSFPWTDTPRSADGCPPGQLGASISATHLF